MACMEPYIPAGYTLTPELSNERQTRFGKAPSMGEGIEQGKQYQAVFETSKGRIVMDLDADEVPNTVNSFVYLIRHHYYDGIVFHRVLDGFMAQTGDPTGTGSGGPGYDFADERTSRRHDTPGVLSMANRGPNTNGSQIFMTFVPTPHLDGRHTVFGRVVEGMDVLNSITRINPGGPGTPDRIERAYVVQK
ncbi:peptidylprolyl isomerase [Deinococcus sp. KNUC1210]|uniref:peptidylprolyl isomerase n=1 Tax=Deinococcus sp. KNUC1210 TaxID=2917691 RepID=UPI001EF0F88E|nr:peptidylprolyl isomerase [Deinococcus sp. KNUC1210]ULH15107.1 peptidylprolyl isomerase [Deinococcus sp. KNUC1210]